MEVERKRRARRKREGPGSVSDTLRKWRELTEELESSSSEKQARKAPAKGSRKGCMKGKGGPENSACKFCGVRQRVWGKWVAEIREPNRGKRMWLGSFRTALEAAHAYDEAARSMYGHSARLNFPGDGGASTSDARTIISESHGSTATTEASNESLQSGVLVGEGAATEDRTGGGEPDEVMNESLYLPVDDFTDVLFNVDEMLRMMDADPWNTGNAGGLGVDCSSSWNMAQNQDAGLLGTLCHVENGAIGNEFSSYGSCSRPARQELFDVGFDGGVMF